MLKHDKVIIIAEAGVNHNGDINLAKRLIDVAKQAGVDYVKFQTWITEELLHHDAPKASYQKINDGEDTSQYQMLKQLELKHEDFKELKEYCDQHQIKFLSTPDEEKSLDFLVDELNLAVIKIGSGEITNIPYLRKVGQKKREVILSTGMATLKEVEIAYHTLIDNGATKVCLLHCTSSYPAPFDSINLKAIQTLKNTFNTIAGYSDHTIGTEVSIAAVALGAKIIEKHFTLDQNMKGPDHKASLSPEELNLLVKQIRNVEKAMLGDGIKQPTVIELDIKQTITKGLFWNTNLTGGQIITQNDVTSKRPLINGGFSASQFDEIVGRKLKTNVKKGNPVIKSELE